MRGDAVAMDTNKGAGPSATGDKDRDLQMLLQELWRLQAKYETSQAPLCPCARPSTTHSGLRGWNGANAPGGQAGRGRRGGDPWT